jgi:N-acetylmuramoyl-L-alanine amidase
MEYKSNNYSERHGVVIDTIVLHHTDGTMPGCAEWLCNPASKVSAHWLIEKDGTLHHLVEDVKCAWHADNQKWNRRSIGIELETALGNPETTTPQMLALWLLVFSLMQAYKVKRENVLGHKEIAPGRKTDPGFDMDEYRAQLPCEFEE